MKNKLLIALIGILMLSFGCKEDFDAVEIRLKNVSSFEYTDATVGVGENAHVYGTIISGESTEYQTYESAYRYANIDLKVDGETYILQPIDFVGEELLENGKYTYELEAIEMDGNRWVSLSLVED